MTFWHGGEQHPVSAVPSKVLHGACGSKGQLKAAVDAVMKKRAAGKRAELPRWRARHESQNLRWQVQDGPRNATRESLVTVTGTRHATVPLVTTRGHEGNKSLRIRYHRELPADASVSFMQVTWNPGTGCYFVTLTLTTAQYEVPATTGMAGIDRGIVKAAVTSDGEYYDSPGLNQGRRRRELLLQQSLDWKRRVLPCKGRCAHEPGQCWRTSLRYARVVTARQRLLDAQEDLIDDGAHKFSRAIARRYAVVVLEDLANLMTASTAKGTVAAPGVSVRAAAGRNREVRAANWGRIEQYLGYKAGQLLGVPAPYTSRTCPRCGYVSVMNRPSQAEFRCGSCGLSGNADVIAAGNIVNAGKTARALRDNGQGSSSGINRGPGASREPANTHNFTVAPGERCGSAPDPGQRSQAGEQPGIVTELDGTVIPETWGIPGARIRGGNRRSRRAKKPSGGNTAGAG
jgi:transposase